MWLKRLDGWVFGKLTSRSLRAVCDEIFYWGLYPFPNQENQVVHDVQQYKMKPAENGQPEHKTPLEEISLALAWVWTCLNILRPPEYEYFILFPFMSCSALSVFSFLHTVRCQMAPAVCRKVQWAGPCCHWRIKHLHWAYVQIQVSLVQRCRRMVLSIPALRKYTFTHIQKHAQAHIHPFYLEDEQYLPWWIFFLFVLWMSFFFFFFDFPCLETRAYDNISCVCCCFFLFVFFVLGLD